MDNINFKKSVDEQSRVTKLEMGGMLVLENSEYLKNELVVAVGELSNKVLIEVKNVQEIDLACIQLILALIRFLDDHHISYQFSWRLSEEHQTLLENVGFGNELFLN